MTSAVKTCIFLANEPLPDGGPLTRYVSFPTAAARIHPVGSAGWVRKRIKFLLRAWRSPRYTRVWLNRLTQPDIAELWPLRPRLATKLQRPYLGCSWNVPERCAGLLNHYDALPRLLKKTALHTVYKTGVPLLRIQTVDSNLQLDVRLFYRDQFEKEGELTIAIEDPGTGLMLAGLSFSLIQFSGLRTLVIGGVQGSPNPRTRSLIRDVAKAMHDLRAKALALWCVQELANRWEVHQIQAVSDNLHVYRHRHRRIEIAACYDEFWAESDGQRLPGGGWTLPLRMRERSREELKPSRRKAHESRYLMLTALREKLQQGIDALSPESSERPFSSTETPVFVCAAIEHAAFPRAGEWTEGALCLAQE